MNNQGNSPEPRNPNNPGNSPKPQARQTLGPWWIWWVLFGALLLWNAISFFSAATPSSATLSYTDFLAQVNAGTVASLTIKGQTIDGAFKQPVEISTTSSPSDTAPAVATPSAVATPQPPTTYTKFTTVAPPNGDPQLLPLLQQKGVEVTAKDTSGGAGFMDILITVLPMLLFLGVILYMGRQARGGTQSLFGFGGSKARLYSEERPGVTLADVAGEDEAKAELKEIVDFLKNPDRYRAIGARLPRGVLLVGPPGTGKTLLARAVAGEANVPFFTISASEFVEMFVGVGASRVRDLFTKAKAAAPAIVFVDEIDAVGRQRGAGYGGGNDEREQTLNQLLVEMDGFDDQTNVIVLSATNRPDVLDPALLRPGRFDRQVTLGLPDRTGREAILTIHTHKLKMGNDIHLDVLAKMTTGFSGADLANLANEAALAAARRGNPVVEMRDFEEALDKIVLGTRQAGLIDEKERRIVAYHEAGHALVARLTPGADPISKITIVPRGRALGVTEQFSDEDRRNYSKDYLLGKLAMMLGGRAAEELVFGQPTTGAESDLKQATGLARRMIGVWGMSESLGPIWYGLGETDPFLGRELTQPQAYGEATAAELDRAVRGLVEEAHKQAHGILDQHRSSLDAVVNELLLHETIDGQQFDVLLSAPISDQIPEKVQGSVESD